MPNKVFIDTSGWAELFIATESYHQQAKEWFTKTRKQNIELVTSNYVVAELVALLNSPLRVPRYQLFQYVDAVKTASYVDIIYIDTAIETAAWSLLKSRSDKTWSLVDATSFIIMQQLGLQEALTTDHHFEQAGFVRLLK
ncbi:type II toxin-antitoxin system VapC family toxin [Microseira sp. BLCC-F43]|uniref:type II toxin-antitoxin system VapC family toxin n=1 Tax=Microseira sp. BLCC-F43 TaxID=3153602 RepID=UPI0035B87ED3